MKEYIEREEAERVAMYVAVEKDHAKELIQRVPAADVVEVRHGRWLLERTPDGKPYCFHCSVCDDDFHHIGIMTVYDYCPNCGAYMMGESNGKCE